MKEDKYIVYEHESPSHKVYVGITKQEPNSRWKEGKGYIRKDNHQPLFANAIIKYGWDNFQHRIVGRNLTLHEANIAETLGIMYYKSLNRSYNITNGGDGWGGCKHTESTKILMSQLKLGNKQTKEHSQRAINNRINNYSYLVLAIKDNEILKFSTAKEAAQVLNIPNRCNISSCISGKQCLVNGYVFMHWPKDVSLNKEEIFRHVNSRINKRYIR